jgi:hypothetical protein
MKKILFFFVVSLLFFSCSEKDIEENPEQEIILDHSLKSQSLGFDWENEEYVSGDPSLPRLPWATGAPTAVPRELARDIDSDEGWILVFNSFSLDDGHDEPNKFLIFYNKFRGIMRFWYYHQGTTAYSDLRYGLQFTGPTSMLNFVGDFAKPMDVRPSNSYVEAISGDWGDLSIGQGLVEN